MPRRSRSNPERMSIGGLTVSYSYGGSRQSPLSGASFLNSSSISTATRIDRYFERSVTCGCQLHVTDRSKYRSMRVAVEMLEEFRKEAPDKGLWRDPPYEYETVKPPIDILSGFDRLRRGIDAGEAAASITADWPRNEAAFRELRRKYLLY